MPRFLIEVPHKAEKAACEHAIRVFLETGSHFLANADWGCYDGDHHAWTVVEVDSREDARSILPPAFRSQAKIVRLDKFTLADVDGMMGQHGDA